LPLGLSVLGLKKILGRGTGKLQATSLTGSPGPYRIVLKGYNMKTITYKNKKLKLPYDLKDG
jgi:hypothetical protein